MNIYNIQELANIFGTRLTWTDLIKKEAKKDISPFTVTRKGQQFVIITSLSEAEISNFYKNNTKYKGKKRPNYSKKSKK